ncbi:MAG: hypothetical protein KJO55_09375 [Gammaproteobacteria bacterium]|nr:hypothetical protein [Gammaproteobacteria bacterium]
MFIALLSVTAAGATAQELPILLDAASTDYDRRNQRILFEQISIARGELGIEAQQADSSQLDFADSTWVFRGNVRIFSAESEVTAATARMRFVDHELRSATITGTPAVMRHNSNAVVRVEATEAVVTFGGNELRSVRLSGAPATFEHRGRDTDVTLTRGRANRLVYDLDKQQMRLEADAWISQADNEIRGNEIVYDIAAERVIAGSDDEDDRVRIIITPPPADDAGDGGP